MLVGNYRNVRCSVPGRPKIWMVVGQGPIALAVGASGGGLDIFTPLYLLSPLSPSLWETARYRLQCCLKGPLNPKQPTNQPTQCWCTLRYTKFLNEKGFQGDNATSGKTI